MSDQLFVGQLQHKVEELKTEFELQRSIKDSTVNTKIQRSRDKICEILRRIQSKRPQPKESTPSEILIETPTIPATSKSFDQSVLQRRHYIFQFKMYLKRKKERQQRANEFKLLSMLDRQTEGLQRWVQQGSSNDNEMLEFFYFQIDSKRKGTIHELQVKQFFQDNPLIMSLFKFDRDNMQAALDSAIQTQRFHFTQIEFIQWLRLHQVSPPCKGFREYIHLFDPSYKQVSLTDNTARILLLRDVEGISRVFHSLQSSGLVNLDTLIRTLRNNKEGDIPLFEDAVHVVDYGVNLLLESALQIIEVEYINDLDAMISWNQLMSFFDNLTEEQELVEQPSEAIEVAAVSDDDYFYSKMNPKEEPVIAPPQVKIKRTRRKRALSATYVDVERMKFTVPKKPIFETREKQRSPGIRQRWLQEVVEQKRIEEEQAYKYKPFKANNVPYKVRDRAFYQELLDKEYVRRKEIKEQSKELTVQNQRPFSFDGRDKQAKELNLARLAAEKEAKLQEDQVSFKANPVPWFCSLKLFDRKREEERVISMNRKKIRQYWLQSNSSMPPRMQEYADRKQIELLEKGEVEVSKCVTSTLPPTKQVPDFQRLHKEFERQLELNKKSKKSTVPIEPRFHASTKQPIRSYMDQQQPKRNEDPLVKAKRALAKKPKLQPRSTAKFDAQVQDIQFRKQVEMQMREQMFMEELQREEKKQLFLPRVQQSWAIADHRQQTEEQQQHNFIAAYQNKREQEQQFNEMMKEIFVRVYQRPLLMEIESLKSQAYNGEQDQQEEQPYDYKDPIGEQEEEEEEQSEKEESPIDPEGVDQVGDQAELSGNEYERYQGQSNQPYGFQGQEEYDDGQEYEGQEYDGQEIEEGDYDPQEYLDLDNIDPKMLDEMQRQALAKQYGITPEQLEQLQKQIEEDEYQEQQENGEMQDMQDNDDDDDYYQQKRHSF